MHPDDTLDLAILDSGDPTRAIVVARNRHDLAIEPLACDHVQAMIAFREQLALAAAGNGQRPTEKALADFGRALFRLVVQNAVSTIYQRLPNSHIRLQIFSNRPDLALRSRCRWCSATRSGCSSTRSRCANSAAILAIRPRTSFCRGVASRSRSTGPPTANSHRATSTNRGPPDSSA